MFIVNLIAMALLCGGSLLSLSTHPHWFIRAWDFPRLQIVVVGLVITLLHFGLSRFWHQSPAVISAAVISAMLFLVGFHGFRIYPYTPLAATQAKSASGGTIAADSLSMIRVVVSNIEQENSHYERWMSTIRQADPDLLIVLEINDRWVTAVSSLVDKFPHQVIQPQDNWYGMMLLSKYPIESSKVHFLVQDDIPSIDATIRLADEQSIRVVGVHPRPPEPIRDTDATARDAELMLWGRELEEESRPVIIGGDLNDVAWSETTRLFMRISGLLDPRRGRGFFNTFNANHWWMRFPLDHIFHSTHFAVRGIKRLPNVGSDHFPIQIDLQFEPSKQSQHEVLKEKPSDDEEADDRVERAQVDLRPL